ncbi:uncharacterized protein [Typha latifolia]|uniref:uncharacterized protein isoform X1 n=1 Tax=Typha latifolia TaxID=4733 RepID=UPI003C2CEE79
MASSLPGEFDSSSPLLAALDLSVSNPRGHKKMEEMDTDLVLEIPDTPERSPTGKPVNSPSRPSIVALDSEEVVGVSSSNRMTTFIMKHANLHFGQSCPSESHIVHEDTESLFEQARLARLLSKTSSSNLSHQSKGSKVDSQQNSVLSQIEKSVETTRKIGKEHIFECDNGRKEAAVRLSRVLYAPNSSTERSESIISTPMAKIFKDKGKEIDLTNDSQDKAKTVLLKELEHDGSRRSSVQRGLIQNHHASPYVTGKKNISSRADSQIITSSSDEHVYSSFTGITNGDNIKATNRGSEPKIGRELQEQIQLEARSKNTRQRKLVRNGFISPNNVRHIRNVPKHGNIGRPASDKLTDVASLKHLHFINSGSEEDDGDKRKEITSNKSMIQNMQHARANSGSDRKKGEEVTIADMEDDNPQSSKDMVLEATLNHEEKAFQGSSHENASIFKRKDTISYLSGQNHEMTIGRGNFVNLVHDNPEPLLSQLGINRCPFHFTLETESESGAQNRRQNQITGKRKCSSNQSNFGESSSSLLEVSENSYVHDFDGRGAQELNIPDLSHRNFQLEHVGLSDETDPRSSQVKSDEILARRLQEQFYQESQSFEFTEEVDETIAWTLQQDDADHARSMARQDFSHSRDRSMAHLYAHRQGFPFQNSSALLTNRDRVPSSRSQLRNFSSPEMDREMTIIAQLRRNFNSDQMDLEMRLNLLEALEDAFENSNDMAISDDFSPDSWDFNEDEYEMLLTLDDSNHQHAGASDTQINSLPLSVIQSSNSEDGCAICLEPPSVGDTVRHLPCLHKFHKDCIDTWLRRRSSCPVCKSGIT